MKKIDKIGLKKMFARNMNIVGEYLEKYRKIFVFGLAAIAALEIFFTIYWFVKVNDGSKMAYCYLVSYIFLFLVSVCMQIFIGLNVKHKFSKFALALAVHIYASLIFIWATYVSILDLTNGTDPIVHLTMIVVVGGLLVISPVLYIGLMSSSFLIIFIFDKFVTSADGTVGFAYYDKKGSVVNMFVFALFAILMGFRHYRIYIKESIARKELETLTYYDQLTGLLNERSYFMECEAIIDKIEKKENVKFGIVVMDVNNVKATNDVYGHRFGCHLIVTGGHKLPEIFTSSKIFHVGGDEYICILYGDDLDNIEETIKKFDEMLRYQIIEFEGKEIILSLARGYSIYNEGETYKDVFQRADNAMYENKVQIKEEYHLAKR